MVQCASVLELAMKRADANAPEGQRPLQLPTTGRRLYGAYVADVLRPAVEPHLAEDQAAVRGGRQGAG